MLLLKTLLSHYRRHPVQGVFLLTGIVAANVMLVSTLLINAQARASQTQGEQLLHSQPVALIEAADGSGTLNEDDYFRLRRQGFTHIAPVLRRFVALTAGQAGGQSLELLGIDVLAMPRPSSGQYTEGEARPGGDTPWDTLAFLRPPYQIWAAPLRLRQLGLADGDRPEREDGQSLPPVLAVPQAGLGHRLLIDIGVLQRITASEGRLSYIAVSEASPRANLDANPGAKPGTLEALERALPPHLQLTRTEPAAGQQQLTRSFHLNLAAMGLLSFIVGVFLIFNAVSFSYTERQPLLRNLKLSGVYSAELRIALLLELGVFVWAGCALGYWLGAQLALALLPGVGSTLAQLYGVYIAYPDQWFSGGFTLPSFLSPLLLTPLLMTVIATLLCAFVPLRQAVAAPALQRQEAAWHAARVLWRESALLIAGVLLLALALLLSWAAQQLLTALAAMAALLLGSALCLPAGLRWMLNGVARLIPAHSALGGWLMADTRWLLGPAALALMALTLALVANSGLNTMIGSFRSATASWLEQRLAAELYVRADIPLEALQAWLSEDAPQAQLAPRFETEVRIESPGGGTVAVDISSLSPNGPSIGHLQLIRSSRDTLGRFRRGQGLLVSERSMRLEGWQTGMRVPACPGQPAVPVLGVYRNYGDTRAQWLMAESLFRACWPRLQPDGIALFGPSELDWDGIRSGLSRDFGLNEQQLVDRRALKAAGMAVFERTFRVTDALNVLTLLIAGIGIFCAVSAISHHRLRQQALLISLGVTRRQRAGLLLAQWGLLGTLCMALVWPLGTALAWQLSAVVTPLAFGWSFALRPEWQHYPQLLLLALLCLAAAVSLPALRLLQTPPGLLLRDEAP